jgi:ribosomal protein S18 acetylase RimI-like enzyme
MFKIKEITAFETIIVRHPVLRHGKPIESCRFEGDDLPTTAHFGLFYEDELSAVISVFKAQNILFTEKKQFQIRGMAVLEQHQKKGLGETLLKYCENQIKNESGEIIWFNARETAVGFYEKSGYHKIGNSFEIIDIGIHYVLFKPLNKIE